MSGCVTVRHVGDSDGWHEIAGLISMAFGPVLVEGKGFVYFAEFQTWHTSCIMIYRETRKECHVCWFTFPRLREQKKLSANP
jgi:hypothetical protein